MEKFAFLMSSCDAYEDLWDPFFEALNTFWNMRGGVFLNVYLNTEHKRYTPRKELSFSVTTLNQRTVKQLSWSRRFMDALERIPEEYVFLILDDFFVCSPIEWRYFDAIIERMERDKMIASFQMCGTRVRNQDPTSYAGLPSFEPVLMGDSGWKTHFVPTIWRKSVLLKWLRPWESIWAFEGCGSARARRWHYPEKVYTIARPPIYDYLWIRDCSAVVNGKWLDEPELTGFFEENDIQIDWGKRGKMTYEEYQAVSMRDILKRYSLRQIIFKSFNRVRSFF